MCKKNMASVAEREKNKGLGRRAARVVSIFMVTLLMAASFSFAGNLVLEDSYPRDGGKGFQPVNMAVTLYFDQEVASTSDNDSKFHIRRAEPAVDEETGEEIAITDEEIRVLYHPTQVGKVLVLLENDLDQNTEYVFTLEPGFEAVSGDTLDSETVINFRIRNTANDSRVNFFLMMGMLVVIFFVSRRSMQKAAEEAASSVVGGKSSEKVNPYKEAKRTGKSVEEIVEKDQKRKEKERQKAEREAEKEAKKGKGEPELNEDGLERITLPNHYKVGAPRTAASGGSTYKTGRAAIAAAKKAAEEARRAAGTTNPKNKKGKKGKKK